jgi:hypothetical protein
MKHFEPKPGGWSRLSAKLTAYDREQARETLLWKGAAAAMIALAVIVATKKSYTPLPEEKSDATIEMPGMPANVHYYWVVN